MHTPRWIPPLLLLTVLLATACRSSPPGGDRPQVRDFGWLAGTWTGTARGMRIVQDWTPPTDAHMRGQHRGYSGDELVLLASMRIVGEVSGVVMVGSPDGEPSRGYRLIEAGRQRLVFQSQRPEFPARGVFERRGDRLTVTFSGLDRTEALREVVYELEQAAD